MKIVNERVTTTCDEDGDDLRIAVVRFRASKRVTDRILRKQGARSELHERLVDDGTLAPNGCECSHCMADRDCCGNFFTYGATYRRASRGFTATQRFRRNV